jgi:tryptophanyl-tRNA synthetase
MKEHYKRGGLGDVKIKMVLFNIIEEILTPIREKRKYYEEHMDEVKEILKVGTEHAKEIANQTLADAKKAMMLDYEF